MAKIQRIKQLITKDRATRLEGSFGTEKEYYHLKKIKAKNSKTEMLWIFLVFTLKMLLK